MISSLILKPTKACNADCSYCSSPPDDNNQWTVNDFKKIMETLASQLTDECVVIWHGGEPMLMGADFYKECYLIARAVKPNIKFAMQTNLLLYKSKLWKDVFENIMGGRISTSFDPDEENRTIKGSTKKYTSTFKAKLANIVDDGFRPLVIGTYTEKTITLSLSAYEEAINKRDKGYHIRVNYRYPAGRASQDGEMLSPESYAKALINIFDRWVVDVPKVIVTPLDQMLQLVLGKDVHQCPWTRSCGGRFMEIEPNGDMYNCGDFSDLQDSKYKYGNIFNNTINQHNSSDISFYKKSTTSNLAVDALNSDAAKLMKRRQYTLPSSCFECEHFKECQGGCMRDAVLYERGIGGKFYYCHSWKEVFRRIKHSILTGEAKNLVESFGYNYLESLEHVKSTNDVSEYDISLF